MNRITFLFTFSFLITFHFANAQDTEQAVGQVKYHFVYIRDTLHRDQPYTESLILLLGKNSSAYNSFDAATYKNLVANEVNNQMKSAPDPNHVNLNITGSREVSTVEYFQFFTAHKLFVKQVLVNDYLTEEALPVMQWTIHSDTIRLNGLHCQRATTHFKGRDYEAWFCPELPFHAGPWKLNGLPGLIVQANDLKKEVIFQFNGFEDLSSQKTMVVLPTNAIKIAQKDLERLRDLEKNDPTAFYKLPSNQIKRPSLFSNVDKTKISSVNIKKPSMPFSAVINNPIELPEKE